MKQVRIERREIQIPVSWDSGRVDCHRFLCGNWVPARLLEEEIWPLGGRFNCPEGDRNRFGRGKNKLFRESREALHGGKVEELGEAARGLGRSNFPNRAFLC